MATIGTRIFTWLKGEFVGADVFGNRYSREKGVAEGRWRRRWVLYKGRPEASKVPPDWHAWLHRTTAAARALLEGALDEVARVEGIALDE